MHGSSFGAFAPNRFDRLVMAATACLPANWIGLRLAILLRRAVTTRLAKDGPIDVKRWGLRMRLHPRDNGCEKNLLFTPQMFEPVELRALAQSLRSTPATFIDIGANVGLWSLYAASVAPHAKIIAIEPEPGNLRRLRFNVQSNPGVSIRVVEAALGASCGEVGIVLHHADRGGARTVPITQRNDVTVSCLTLLEVLRKEGVSSIDALKIDIECSEDTVLDPFFRHAHPNLWPRLLIIEDTRAHWRIDLFEQLKTFGYVEQARGRGNVILCRS